MQIRRLGAPALEVLHLNCSWSYPEGWQLTVRGRRSGEVTWHSSDYERLASAELFDVASIELEALL